MGHLAGKDIYKKLAGKMDGMMVRTPSTEVFFEILRELYTSEEAEVMVKMPFIPVTLKKLKLNTGFDESRLSGLLENMAAKGLILDLYLKGECRYVPSPFVIGVFEFTMMRTDGAIDRKKLAGLFNKYLSGNDGFYAANFQNGESVSPVRVLPHNEALEDNVEILEYEKAQEIVRSASRIAVGACSCRHEKLHAEDRECRIPLDTCTSFGKAADFIIRRNFGREVSKEEMLEKLEFSRENGLVFTADNTKKDISFICHCCDCCCNVLMGIGKFGYANSVVTSSLIANLDKEKCNGCLKCVEACPVKSLGIYEKEKAGHISKYPAVDTSFCLGCGVCSLKCSRGAIRLNKRNKRVLHPENTFERIILQCLERGTLQNYLFSDPENLTHNVLRGIIGGFLKLPPVKRGLMSDSLRSVFLSSLSRAGEKYING